MPLLRLKPKAEAAHLAAVEAKSLNLFFAFNLLKTLMDDWAELCVPTKVLLRGILQCMVRVSIKQGELTAKGVHLTHQGQVLDEVFFHFPGVVNADWHMDLNRSASNRVQPSLSLLCRTGAC